ncbi:RFX DNA-binding domain-domain-containing protein [Absidia repens]|uniref:RFX DNA-binding domain-domain-containing protein n=1 Tax=Absidia repens TaxID=90262 RepID=A0A1X2ISI4_9FUNG|nr:RFX DNA-binding domain-domain-containing protein [Absidia repens]
MNYERMPNSNVPRSSIFEHYQLYCTSRYSKPVNAATFGKLIRMTFPGISTRRLGNRGQSKYQYCNIQRIETRQSDRLDLMELPTTNSMESYAQQHHGQQQQIEGLDSNAAGMLINWDTDADQSTSRPRAISHTSMLPTTSSSENNSHSTYDTHGFPSYRLPPPIGFTPSSSSSSLPLAPHLGDLVSDFSGPNKPYQQNYSPPLPAKLASSPSSASTSSQLALDTSSLTDELANLYNQHCRELYNTIYAGQFDQIQSIYERFYYETPSQYRSLLNTNKMVEAVWRWDCVLYDSLIVILLPEVDTFITDRMMSGLLRFTQTLPKFLTYLLRDYSVMLRQKKFEVASIFVAKLRRHLTLNEYAKIASDVLHQSILMENMKADWKKLDIDAIIDHVSWICDCRSEDIRQILAQDIPSLLDDDNTLGKWMKWEGNLVHKYLPSGPKTREKTHIDECLKTAKQFMLKWKVYTGLVIQEFYAMVAPSIDSLKALLYFLDDLVLYHVEERIANMNAILN